MFPKFSEGVRSLPIMVHWERATLVPSNGRDDTSVQSIAVIGNRWCRYHPRKGRKVHSASTSFSTDIFSFSYSSCNFSFSKTVERLESVVAQSIKRYD
ncbi:hypothetical protein AVEN_255092-1 [Araneus ventricosus]|uniref:Uncharacterized protein n=1 Tax=Araneus ventricosus TaxID=182803 RepID=A0A4Y2EG33_ARAVE|nr:hypothetical protein AVEN_255092-1 [Araneus ventricosus]